VPDEAAPIVRALLTADRNQFHARARMTDAQRKRHPRAVDFRPFIIADADTGHGGDAHVRNLVRRFVEVGVPGYHIEDQKPGVKKCGHQGGKVLVPIDEQIKRLSAARFQLDIMQVPGSSSPAPTPSRPRCSTAAATSAISRSSSASRTSMPTYKAAFLAILRASTGWHRGAERARAVRVCDAEYAAADAWLDAPASRHDRRGGAALPEGRSPAASTPRSTRCSTASSTCGRPRPT
jgi:isocitrate lyase